MPTASRSASTPSGAAFFTPIRTKRDHLLHYGLPGLALRRPELYGKGALKLSVVIPTLNEEASLRRLLDRLRLAPNVHEVVVSDGGSSDRTATLVRPPHRLVQSEPGRGQQLRTGAEAATGDALLFLHADVLPPADVAAQISGALSSGHVGGNFRLRHLDGGPLGRWLERLAPLYRRMPRYYGDSGIFARKDVYDACGGFPWVPIMEDVIFVRRMEAAGRTAYLPGPMVSAARRWRGRELRTLLLWGFMQSAFALGVTPWRLARFYQAAKS
ncbi:MAG: TIGR04283 family arsenosugar biosynthesis glycosyltransferase [Rubrobacter sp.]|jgi:rSAM/selenodomain-associated transferase 2|nr:TIGR04283 family arsenosugar biosynthesis glycosyltransferase [Rubrobacter sp.]MDQ3376252.1 TIGR04283 family arsenosugar biosynthesis glycosyltransferase [Actinomycetota bacterium]